MATEGFQSSTRPIDTFVQQSTVAGIKYTGGLNDVATALAAIEPALQKFIVQKIKKVKEEEVAEAQTKGDEAARKYTKKQRLLFPEGVEIDETSPEFAETVSLLSGKINESDRKIYQGKSVWYKNAFEEAKAIRLGKTYGSKMLVDYQTFRVSDPKTGIEKPLSAYPYNSATVQNFLSSYRNKNVELANVSPFHFQRSFLPEIQKGTEKFITKHTADHAEYKLEAHKEEIRGGLKVFATDWEEKKKANAGKPFSEIDFTEEKETLKLLVENVSKFYQGKDLSDFYKDVFIPFVNETGKKIAGNEALGENRFELAMEWIEQVPQLFPKGIKTKTVVDKNGEVRVEPVMEVVYLKDDKGDFILDGASGDKIIKYAVDEDSGKTKPVLNFALQDKTVLESKQNYLKNKNAAKKFILNLEKDYNQFGKEKEIIKNKNRLKQILIDAKDRDLTKEERNEFNTLIATSSKARTFIENNRNTFRSRTYDGGLYLYNALDGGQYREAGLAETAINSWWEKSLKLPEDKKLYNKMLGTLENDIDEERIAAAKYVNQKVTSLNKTVREIAKESDNGIMMVDTAEQAIEEYKNEVKQFVLTKANFNNELDNQGKPVLRYPTQLEAENFADKKFITLKDGLTSTLAALNDQEINFDPLSDVNLDRAKKGERMSFSRHLFRIKQNPPVNSKGDLEPITLQYVLDNYDIKEINGTFFFDQYKDKEGNYDTSSNILETVLEIIDLSDEEIEKYGLIDVLRNSTRPKNQERAANFKSSTPFADGGQGFSLPEDYTETEKQVFDDSEQKQKEVIPKKVDKNTQESNVSNETEDKKTVIEEGGIKQDDTEVKRNFKLSKIFAIPEGAKDGDFIASGEVPFPIGAGEDFGKRFNLFLETEYGFDTESRIYKQMPNYMKSNLMGSFQDLEAEELGTQEETPTVTGEFIQSQDLSEVKSDMTPNLGLRDGSLIAMALPFKGKETKEQEDTQVTISKEPNAIQRMETNFKTIYALAKEVGIKFPEVIAAQFGAESDHGLLVTGKNNYFGIKATQAEIDAGQSTLAPTFEEIDGKKVRVMAHFKNFDSIRESIEHYKKFWNDDFQDRKGLINVNTAEEAIIRLKENGYATDSDYVKLVTDVLNDARREPPLF